MRRVLPLLFAGLAVFASAPAWAATTFTLKNAAATPVVSFETREDDRWSDNWLRAPVAAGETFKMSFNADSGDCLVRIRVRFQNGRSVEGDVDFCEAKTLEVTERSVSAR